MCSLRVKEWSDPGAIQALREAWCGLQELCPQATPWQTWEWNEAWWRNFGALKRVRLLCFYTGADDEMPVGIAPLYTSSYLMTPLRRLAWLGTGPSDYLGILALPDREDEVAESLLRYLREEMTGWDIADLQQLSPNTSLLRLTTEEGHAHETSGPVSVLAMEPCPYLALPTTWEALTARLGKKMRFNLGYYDRLLRKDFGEVEYLLADENTLDAGMTALFDLHQRRWNARKLPGVLGSNRVQRFHREVAARFLERGWLRLHLLSLDGDYVAAIYCYATGGRTYYYLGGFNLELGKYSPGTLLTAQAIRHAIAEKHGEFDFLRGHEGYKYRWQPEERMNHRLLMLRSQDGFGGLRSRAGLTLNRAEYHVVERARAFAEKQGSKGPITKAANAETVHKGKPGSEGDEPDRDLARSDQTTR